MSDDSKANAPEPSAERAVKQSDVAADVRQHASGERALTDRQVPHALEDGQPEIKGQSTATPVTAGQYLGWLKHGLPSDACPLPMAAWSYRSKGLSIFPTVAGGKEPATSHGFRDATDDKQQVSKWWGAHPEFNIGLSCGPDNDLAVLDVDAKNGGLENWRALQDEHGEVNSPMIVETPSGGLHYYFRLGNTPMVKSEARIAPGIDVRGPTRNGTDGSYVLVPPSIVNAKRYRWKTDTWVYPSRLPLTPEWLQRLAAFDERQQAEIDGDSGLKAALDAAASSQWRQIYDEHLEAKRDARREARGSEAPEPGAYATYIQGALDGEFEIVATAEIGQQESILNKAAYKIGTLLAGAGYEDIDDEVALGAVDRLIAAGLQMENAADRDAWTEDEIERKVRRGMEHGMQHPREDMPAPLEDVLTVVEKLRALHTPCTLPADNGPAKVDPASLWENPKPLVLSSSGGQQFPLMAFPLLMKDTVEALAERHEASPTLCAQSVLAAANLAAHARYDALRLDNSKCPISLYLVTLAESGERKSSVDSTLMRPVDVLEEHDQRTFEQEKFEYDLEMVVHEKLHEAAKKEKDVSQMRVLLASLQEQPEPPLWRIRKTADFTIEGLGKVLQYGLGYIAISSTEGGSLVGGHSFTADVKLRTATALIQLWDGQSMMRVRVSEQVRLAHRRANMNLMIQPRVAANFLTDEILREQGFINRLLVAAPESLAGYREYPQHAAHLAKPIVEFHAKLKAQLEIQPAVRETTRNELDPTLLELAPAARDRIREFQRGIEPLQREGREFAHIRGYANRLNEQAVRLAATLQAFMDPNAKEISGAYAEQAIRLAEFFAHEMARLQGLATAAKQIKHAIEVLRFLLANRASGKGSTFKVRLLCQSGPRPRDEQSVRQTLRVLADHGHVYPLGDDGKRVENWPAKHTGNWQLNEKSSDAHCAGL